MSIRASELLHYCPSLPSLCSELVQIVEAVAAEYLPMGNSGSSLFATPQEQEFRKLTEKNTNVNRVSLNHVCEEPSVAAKKSSERQRLSSVGSLRFDNLITEVSYDREQGEIEARILESSLCSGFMW